MFLLEASSFHILIIFNQSNLRTQQFSLSSLTCTLFFCFSKQQHKPGHSRHLQTNLLFLSTTSRVMAQWQAGNEL